MKYKYSTMTQTQLGKLFGVTSHIIGRWLKDIGLRDENNRPTQKAHDDCYCETVRSEPYGYNWVWRTEKTVAALVNARYRLIANPPQSLVAPAILNGPFSVRRSTDSGSEIENGDGTVSVWANNQMTADVIARILNVAHERGVIDRLCQPQRLLQLPTASASEIEGVIKPFE